MQTKLNRRHFLAAAALAPIAHVCHADHRWRSAEPRSRPARFFFVSQGKTALINADGTGLRYLEFDVPNQAPGNPPTFSPTDIAFCSSAWNRVGTDRAVRSRNITPKHRPTFGFTISIPIH
jgi:hypothetical protein